MKHCNTTLCIVYPIGAATDCGRLPITVCRPMMIMGGCASRQRTSARRLAVRLVGNLGVVDAARSDYSRAASHPYTFRLSLTRSSFPVCSELIVSRLVATVKVEHVYEWRASAGKVEPARSQPLHGDRRRNSQPQAAIVLWGGICRLVYAGL